MLNLRKLKYDIEAKFGIVVKGEDQLRSLSSKIRKDTLSYQAAKIAGDLNLTKVTKTGLIMDKLKLTNLRSRVALNKLNLKSMERQLKLATRFKMEALGIMFFGMTGQRLIIKFVRSVTAAYNDAFEKTSNFEKITNKLTASWKYFQFTMVDALTQIPLFKNIVDYIADFIDKISGMDLTTKLAMWLEIGLAGVIFTGMLTIGTLTLGLSSLLMSLGLAPTVGAAVTLTIGTLAVGATLAMTMSLLVRDLSAKKWLDAFIDAAAIAGIASVVIFALQGNFIGVTISLTALATLLITKLIIGLSPSAKSKFVKFMKNPISFLSDEIMGRNEEFDVNLIPEADTADVIAGIENASKRVNEDSSKILTDFKGMVSGMNSSISNTSDGITTLSESIDDLSNKTSSMRTIMVTNTANGLETLQSTLGISAQKARELMNELAGTPTGKMNLHTALGKISLILVGESVVPDLKVFGAILIVVREIVRTVTTVLVSLREAIEAIPNETHKYLYYHIVTIHEEGD